MSATNSTHPARVPLARVEDARLLTGQGRYVHDIQLPGMWHAAFVRSVFARARILSVDIEAAFAIDGVEAVLTGHDLIGLCMPAPNALLDIVDAPATPLLPTDTVNAVGQPLALVLASSAEAAQRGAEAVWFECETEPACNDLDDAAPTVASVRHHEAAQATLELPPPARPARRTKAGSQGARHVDDAMGTAELGQCAEGGVDARRQVVAGALSAWARPAAR